MSRRKKFKKRNKQHNPSFVDVMGTQSGVKSAIEPPMTIWKGKTKKELSFVDKFLQLLGVDFDV